MYQYLSNLHEAPTTLRQDLSVNSKYKYMSFTTTMPTLILLTYQIHVFTTRYTPSLTGDDIQQNNRLYKGYIECYPTVWTDLQRTTFASVVSTGMDHLHTQTYVVCPVLLYRNVDTI